MAPLEIFLERKEGDTVVNSRGCLRCVTAICDIIVGDT